MQPSIETDILVIGAGVIGLACARELSAIGSVVLIENHFKFGQETSSRNSEVIHSGIYYKNSPEKRLHCIRGRNLLYAFCRARNIPFQKTGKIVLATQESEFPILENLAQESKGSGVDFKWMGKKDIQSREPLVHGERALFFPLSGIVDSHAFMQVLERDAIAGGVTIAYRHRYLKCLRQNPFLVELVGPEGKLTLSAKRVVNAAGLFAHRISNEILSTKCYEHRPCQGRYFALPSRFHQKFQTLVYPIPEKDGVGVHVTLDLEGQARLGPDVHWLSPTDTKGHYEVDWEKIRPAFAKAAKRYLPDLQENELAPGLVGIRPKLFLNGEASPDFLVERHGNFLHCLGIESPGLTASLSLSQKVLELLSTN